MESKSSQNGEFFDLYEGLEDFCGSVLPDGKSPLQKSDDEWHPQTAAEGEEGEERSLEGRVPCTSSFGYEAEVPRIAENEGVDGEREEEDDDDFVFLVDDSLGDPETQKEEIKGDKVGINQKRRNLRSLDSNFHVKERVLYFGAPGTVATESAGAQGGSIDRFAIVGGIPWWMDISELSGAVEASCGGKLAFSRILSDSLTGAPLGVGILEFSSSTLQSAFLAANSQFTAKAIPRDVFDQLCQNPHYRDGLCPEKVKVAVCSEFGVSTGRETLEITQEEMTEIAFENQQAQLIKNGDFQVASKTFPWFSLDLLSFMRRRDKPGKSKFDRERQDDDSSDLDISNHLMAYRQSNKIVPKAQMPFPQFFPQMAVPHLVMANYLESCGRIAQSNMEHAKENINSQITSNLDSNKPRDNKRTHSQKRNDDSNKRKRTRYRHSHRRKSNNSTIDKNL